MKVVMGQEDMRQLLLLNGENLEHVNNFDILIFICSSRSSRSSSCRSRGKRSSSSCSSGSGNARVSGIFCRG